jgi:hypothetical protein
VLRVRSDPHASVVRVSFSFFRDRFAAIALTAGEPCARSFLSQAFRIDEDGAHCDTCTQ